MRYVQIQIVLCLVIVYISVQNTKGKSLGHNKELKYVNRDTIVNLRNDLRRVLHFLGELSDDSLKNNQVPDKSRSRIPYEVWHIKSPERKHKTESLVMKSVKSKQRDESVVKATANQAAKAVKESKAATLQTQEGVKVISKGLDELRKCIKKFQSVITM